MRNGIGENRTTAINDRLTFHQHFIDSDTTKFTFEPTNGTEGNPPLTFLKGEFQVVRFRPYKDIILTTRDQQSRYYILNFDDSEKSDEFMYYIVSFLDFDVEYTFPQGYDG